MYIKTPPERSKPQLMQIDWRRSVSITSLNLLTKYNFGLNLKQDRNKLVIGKKYSLKGIDCDDFNMSIKTYELIAILEELGGIDLNSVLMKQVDGNLDMIFSLTKLDCETLQIPFQKGLQIFPKNMDWIPYDEKKQELINVNLNDLSSYPKSTIDGTIRNIIIKLTGFKNHRMSKIITPNNTMVDSDFFTSTLKVIVKEEIPSMEACCSFYNGEAIPFNIITKSIGNSKEGENCITDADDNIYLELNLYKLSNIISQTVDGCIGVSPLALVDKTIGELFNVIWEEQPTNNHRQPYTDTMPKYWHHIF